MNPALPGNERGKWASALLAMLALVTAADFMLTQLPAA